MKKLKYYLPIKKEHNRNVIFDITPIVNDVPLIDSDVVYKRVFKTFTNERDAIARVIQLMLYAIPGNKAALIVGNVHRWIELTLATLPPSTTVDQKFIRVMVEIGRRMCDGTGYFDTVGSDFYYGNHSATVIGVPTEYGYKYVVSYPVIIKETKPKTEFKVL